MLKQIHNAISFLYRLFKIIQLRKKVSIALSARINPQTHFGGWNSIHSGAVVSGSILGRFSFVGENSYLPQCKIGSFCSIGPNVKVVAETHPLNSFISTSPVFYSLNKTCGKTFAKEQLFNERKCVEGTPFRAIIGNDVWIGEGATIMGGGGC